MRRTRSRHLLPLASVLVLAVLAPVLGVPAAAHEGEASGPSGPSGVPFTSTPDEGPTGSVIEVAGEGCFLIGSDEPGEGVVLRLKSRGEVLAYVTLPVDADGTWSGTLDVPAGLPVRTHHLEARCVYPLMAPQVTYARRAFTVTGGGPVTEANPTPPTFNGGIEPYGEYDGQSTCSPGTKPGMAAFIRLVHRHYGGGSLGVGRACGVGGQSEHKEGRAWDWAMNAGSAADRSRVQALMNWLFATDSRCRHYANARRLGMMYIIWNRRMFRMYDVDRGWAQYSGSSPHTDHVHFSLTRDGGAGQVSYWNPTFRAPTGWSADQRRVRNVTIGRDWDAIRPLSGDFDGDELDDLLWYDPVAGDGFIGYSRDDGRFVARPITMAAERVPLVGDFNGDCEDDIVWYGPGGLSDHQWQGRPNRTFRAVVEDIPGTFARPVVGDFNGDRHSDIAFYGPGAARDALWRGTPYGFVPRNLSVGGDFRPFPGDFDGDRRDDIFWYGPGEAGDSLSFGTADGFAPATARFDLVADPLVGDLNGDDRTDIFWYRSGQRTHRVWTGLASRRFGAQSVEMEDAYTLPAVGDFDADLQDDVLWHGGEGNRIWYY